jgi:GNAT superfamily N-acetyltransferase
VNCDGRRRSLRPRRRGHLASGWVARSEVVLRLVGAADDLGPVLVLSGELTEWARGRTLADYGIELEFESDQALFRDLEVMRESRARLYVAEIGAEPVGMGGLRPLVADEAEIKRMYVRPSARGLGVGRAILQRLVDDARALGYKTIRLDSAPFMHEAHALYGSFGFVPSSPHEGWEFEGVPALRDVPVVFMSLDLGPDY